MNSCLSNRGFNLLKVEYLYIPLLISIIFPYVQPVVSQSYTQPYAYVFGLLIFAIKFKNSSYQIIHDFPELVLLSIVGVVVFIISCYPFSQIFEFKYLLNYIGPLLIAIPVYFGLLEKKILIVRAIQIGILIWVVISIVQRIYDPFFLTSLIGQWGESANDIIRSGRGVIGLAPEPTHHGFHILLMGASLILIDQSRQSRLLVFMCLIDAIFLAASSSAFLCLIIAFGLYLIVRKTVLIIFLGLIIYQFYFWGGIEYITNLDIGGSRMLNLIITILTDPLDAVLSDASVNARLGGIYACFYDVFSHFILPRGLSHESWLQSRSDLLMKFKWVNDLSDNGAPSGWGIILYQVGFLSFPVIGRLFYGVCINNVKEFFSVILVMAIPFIFLSYFMISAPSFGIAYASLIYSHLYLKSKS